MFGAQVWLGEGCLAGPGARCGAGAHLAKSPEIVRAAGSHASGGHITKCLGPDVLEVTETASQNLLDPTTNESDSLCETPGEERLSFPNWAFGPKIYGYTYPVSP